MLNCTSILIDVKVVEMHVINLSTIMTVLFIYNSITYEMNIAHNEGENSTKNSAEKASTFIVDINRGFPSDPHDVLMFLFLGNYLSD